MAPSAAESMNGTSVKSTMITGSFPARETVWNSFTACRTNGPVRRRILTPSFVPALDSIVSAVIEASVQQCGQSPVPALLAIYRRCLRTFSIFAMAAFAFPALAQSPSPRVLAVNIDGVVHPITVEIGNHAIEQAQAQHAELLLIRLNTPGGLLDATRHIIEELEASPVPVITYVTPSGGRAASAGFFLLEAGDIAAMAPGTNTGAASPVLIGQQMEETMRKKVENDAA